MRVVTGVSKQSFFVHGIRPVFRKISENRTCELERGLDGILARARRDRFCAPARAMMDETDKSAPTKKETKPDFDLNRSMAAPLDEFIDYSVYIL